MNKAKIDFQKVKAVSVHFFNGKISSSSDKNELRPFAIFSVNTS